MVVVVVVVVVCVCVGVLVQSHDPSASFLIVAALKFFEKMANHSVVTRLIDMMIAHSYLESY